MDPRERYRFVHQKPFQELPVVEPFSSLQADPLRKARSLNGSDGGFNGPSGALRAPKLKVHLEVYGSKHEKPQKRSRT